MVAKETDKSFTARHWRLLLNIFVVLAFIGLAVGIRNQLADNFSSLDDANVWFLLLLIPLQFLNYDEQSRLYSALYKVFDEKLSYWNSFKLSLEMTFINTVFPSGGISGMTYMGARMRGSGRSGSRAVLMQLMKLMMTFLAFELVLAIGLLILAGMGHINSFTVLTAGVLTTAIVIATVIFIFIITSARRVMVFADLSVKFLQTLARWSHVNFLQNVDLSAMRKFMDEMHSNYKYMEKNYKQLQPAFWHAFLMDMWEVLSVFVVFVAFGHVINIGVIILAYAVANLSGIISVLPGGAGLFEISMTGVLVVGGVSAGLALTVIVVYRVIDTVMQVPFGWYLYHRGLHGMRL